MQKKILFSLLIASNSMLIGCGSSSSGAETPASSSPVLIPASSSSQSSQASEPSLALDEFASTRYEAEYTELLGGSSIQFTPTASAGKYLSIPVDIDNGLRFLAQADAQSLRIAYTANTAGTVTLSINSMPTMQLWLAPSESWTMSSHNIAVNEGDEVSLHVADGDISLALDYIELNPRDKSLQAFEQLKLAGSFTRDSSDHILLDPDNNLFASTPRLAGPLHYLSELEREDDLFTEAKGIVGVAYNQQGELYVADFVGGAILKRDIDGNEHIVMANLDKPTGITFNANNEMFVSLFGNASSATIIRINEADGTTETVAQNSQMSEVIGLASDEAGSVYASTWNTGTLYRINPEGVVSQLAKIPGISATTQNGINQMAYSHGFLYVTAGSPRQIHRINTQTGTIETINEALLALDSASQSYKSALNSVNGSITVANDGETLLFSTEQKTVYALKRHDDKYRFVSTFAQLDREVDGSQVTPEGDLLLGGGAHTKITLEGKVENLDFGGRTGLGMDYDSEGNLYFANWGDRSIYKMSNDGTVTTWADIANYPNSVLVKNDNEIYAAMCGNNWEGNNVTKYDADGNILSNIIINDSSNSCITSIAQSPQGVLFASNWRRGTITRIEDDIPTLLTTINNSNGVAANINHIVYAEGAIYAPSRNFNQIYKVSETGEVTVFSGTTNAISKDGHIEAADFGSIMNISLSNNHDALYTVEDNGRVKIISSYKLPVYQ